jgi:hypothetical protein
LNTDGEKQTDPKRLAELTGDLLALVPLPYPHGVLALGAGQFDLSVVKPKVGRRSGIGKIGYKAEI